MSYSGSTQSIGRSWSVRTLKCWAWIHICVRSTYMYMTSQTHDIGHRDCFVLEQNSVMLTWLIFRRRQKVEAAVYPRCSASCRSLLDQRLCPECWTPGKSRVCSLSSPSSSNQGLVFGFLQNLLGLDLPGLGSYWKWNRVVVFVHVFRNYYFNFCWEWEKS